MESYDECLNIIFLMQFNNIKIWFVSEVGNLESCEAFESFECLESFFLEMFEFEIFKILKIITYICAWNKKLRPRKVL